MRLGPRQLELIEKIKTDGFITLMYDRHAHWLLSTNLESVPGRLAWSLVNRGLLTKDPDRSSWNASTYVITPPGEPQQ